MNKDEQNSKRGEGKISAANVASIGLALVSICLSVGVCYQQSKLEHQVQAVVKGSPELVDTPRDTQANATSHQLEDEMEKLKTLAAEIESLKAKAEEVDKAQKSTSQMVSTIQDSSQKLLNEVQNIMALLEKMENDVAAPASLQRKSEQYLVEARKATGPTTGKLYEGALRYAEDKMPVLLEYVEWKAKELDSQEDVIAAQEQLALLKVFCDEVLVYASPADWGRFEELRNRIARVESGINSRVEAELKQQNQKLDSLETLLSDAPPAAVPALYTEWKDKKVRPELEDRYEQLMVQLHQKRSCLTSSQEPLLLPYVSEDTPWEPWLTNFSARLDDESLPMASRIEDCSAAVEVLAAAENAPDAEGKISVLLRKIERQLMVLGWRNQVDLLQSRSGEENQQPLLVQLESLESQTDSFDEATLQNVQGSLAFVYKKLYDLRSSALDKEQKKIEQHIGAEDMKKQFIDGITQQRWQLWVEFLEWCKRCPALVDSGPSAPEPPSSSAPDLSLYQEYETKINKLDSDYTNNNVKQPTVHQGNCHALAREIREHKEQIPDYRKLLKMLEDSRKKVEEFLGPQSGIDAN